MPVFAVFLRVSVTKQDTAVRSRVCSKDISANNSKHKHKKAEGKISAFSIQLFDILEFDNLIVKTRLQVICTLTFVFI